MAKAPMNPLAGPSGPGDKSTRTDQLTLGSAFYADDLAKLNTAAPKSKTRGVADNVGGRPKNCTTCSFIIRRRRSKRCNYSRY
jgi:hypothetical protein